MEREEKVIISATVKKKNQDKIVEFAQNEERSFSNMLDLLLSKAIVNYEKEKDAKNNSD